MNDVYAHETAQTYNGWVNRETWLMNVWLTNETAHYELLVDAIGLKCPAVDKAEWLKDAIEQELYMTIDSPCVWQDLLVSCMTRVDWCEIIKSNSES